MCVCTDQDASGIVLLFSSALHTAELGFVDVKSFAWSLTNGKQDITFVLSFPTWEIFISGLLFPPSVILGGVCFQSSGRRGVKRHLCCTRKGTAGWLLTGLGKSLELVFPHHSVEFKKKKKKSWGDNTSISTQNYIIRGIRYQKLHLGCKGIAFCFY